MGRWLVLLLLAGQAWVKPAGTLNLNATTARFDTDAVEGPTVSMKRRPDGSWGGTLQGKPLDVRLNGDRLVGSELKGELRRKGSELRMEGQWQGTRFRYELTPERLVVRLGTAGADYLRQPDGALQAQSHSQRGGSLTGAEGLLDAPLPLLLALIAAGEP